MSTIRCTLLVALKGADLAAATASLTLINKMGYGDRLIGIKRFDWFELLLKTSAPPARAIESLKATLDRQSTFYNRNKHVYSLACTWPGGSDTEGISRDELRRRWKAELANYLQNKGDTESGGKDPANPLMFGGSCGFLVEVQVEDDDTSTRDAIAAKVEHGLSRRSGTEDVRVTCQHRGALWWLALWAPDAATADETARHITVTQRRDRGLLANPNYESVEFVPARQL